jgi:hypothetical protein
VGAGYRRSVLRLKRGPGRVSRTWCGCHRAILIIIVALAARSWPSLPWPPPTAAPTPPTTQGTSSRSTRSVDDGGLGRRYPGEQVRANPLANQALANPAPHGAREIRVHPFAFARLQMAVSEGLCSRPIQARAISQTAFEAWVRP